jgi:hypothetical protein
MYVARVRFWLLLLLALGQSAAADVYRWVDEHGRVHFGDRPPASEAVETTTVETQTGPPPDAASSSSDRGVARQRLLDQYQKERDAKQEAAQRKREEEQRREQLCVQARTDLENYRTHPMLYEMASNGERRYLSDEERAQTIAEARQAVEHWCD